MPQQTVLSTDQLRLVVDAFARFRIVDPQRMYQTVGTEENVKDALARILASRLRNELGRQPFAALLSPERTTLMEDIKDSVNRQARSMARRSSTCGSSAPTCRPARRWTAPIRGCARRASRRRSPSAPRATSRRSWSAPQADANAAHIYADAFGKDPQFYAFYRAMQAYRETFKDSNSTIILSPNNEFLREFEGRPAK